jgi:hypothetical protein
MAPSKLAQIKDDDELDERSPGQQIDEEILKEARERFKRGYDFEADFRPQYLDDIKFAAGDPDNHWQWPSEVYNQRVSDTSKKPTMTVNVVQGMVFSITNDFRQNLPSVAIKPTGDESTFDSAQIFEALMRNVEYTCNARSIYMDCYQSEVEGGIAYCRVNTAYDDDDTDAQSFVIEPVRSHMGVLLDCDIKQKDGSDAGWGFIWDQLSKEEFERQYPKVDLTTVTTPLDIADDWIGEDSIRVCEYYRIEKKEDELIWFREPDKDGQPGHISQFKMSTMPPEIKQALKEAEANGSEIKRRRIWNRKLQWFKIAGNQIIARIEKLPGSGKYIPIIRWLGRERLIEGKLDRKGIVRPLKDTQRSINYNVSSDTEFNALQPKSPYVGPKAAFEGNETAWNSLNTKNPPYLPVNHKDEDGEPIPEPTRSVGPTEAPAYANAINRALQHMGIISGIPDAKLGQTSNERSGLAIKERRQGGENANYDFAENAAMAVTHIGRIFLDWAPHVYDTERTVKAMGRDGQQTDIKIQPDLKAAMQKQLVDKVEKVLFDPSVGKYEVQSNVGPSFATQREQAWEAMTKVIVTAPDEMKKMGDLAFRTADFPLADKIAERYQRDIEHWQPWLLEDGQPPAIVTQLTQANQQLTGVNAQLLDQLGTMEKKLQDQQADIGLKAYGEHTKRYDAESKRVTAISNAEPELEKAGLSGELEAMMRKVLADILGDKDKDADKPPTLQVEHTHTVVPPETPVQ